MGHDITPLANISPEAKSVLICIHPQSTYDAVAAALAWKLAWEQSGKSVSVVCPAPMRAEYSRLAGIDQVVTEAGNRDLVMSFPFDENIVDKVSYNVNEASGQFELIISPKNGFSSLDPAVIQYRQSGLAADMIVLFGYHAFAELGELYTKEKYVFDHAFTVAVTQSNIPKFAKFHVALQPENLSYSEWAYYILSQLQIGNLSESIATNLLQGIEYATDRLVAVANPRTFETVAQLMRAQARRQFDNPAFSYLSTPIDAVSAPQWQPAQSGAAVQDFEEYAPESFDSGVVRQLGHTNKTRAVAPNEFAQAMGRRN